MKIGIIGYGGVGKALVRLLHMQKDLLSRENLPITVNYIIDYYGGIYNPVGIDLSALIDFTEKEKDITKFAGGNSNLSVSVMAEDPEIDLAVIMTPTDKETGQPGLGYAKALLDAGKHVVISDKGPVMLSYHNLAKLAREKGVQLGIGCTTGGALPSVNGGVIDLSLIHI